MSLFSVVMSVLFKRKQQWAMGNGIRCFLNHIDQKGFWFLVIGFWTEYIQNEFTSGSDLGFL